MVKKKKNKIETLLADLQSEDKGRQHRALKAMRQVKDSVLVPYLLDAMDRGKDQHEIRWLAYKALEKNAVDEAAVQPLANALNSENEWVRHKSLEVLAGINVPEASELLIELLQNGDETTRSIVAQGFRHLGTGADVAVVIALTDCLENDSDAHVRADALWALSRIGHPASRDGLLRAMRNKRVKGWSSGLFSEALVKIKDSSVVPELFDMLDDPSCVECIIWAIGHLGDRQAAEELMARYKSFKPELREEIITALGQIGDPVAVPFLIETLNDSRRVNRKRIYQYAEGSLKKIGTSEALHALNTWRNENRKQLWRQAYQDAVVDWQTGLRDPNTFSCLLVLIAVLAIIILIILRPTIEGLFESMDWITK